MSSNLDSNDPSNPPSTQSALNIKSILPGRLAHFMNRLEVNFGFWTSGDLKDIWEHQMNAPMLFHVAPAVNSASHGTPISLRELFKDPSPAKDLLHLAKNFAKLNCDHPNPVLPPAVSLALYYLSIAVALARNHERITNLNDHEIETALSWVLQLEWIDAETRLLCLFALAHLKSQQNLEN